MWWLTRLRARAPQGDGGAAAIVAILLSSGVLFGMAALTVDVGQIYSERRQLQNGADAAVLAVAQDAAVDCDPLACSATDRAQEYASANAVDDESAVREVCGGGWAGVAACDGQEGPEITRCSDSIPGGAEGFIRVRTATGTAGGETLLPHSFSRALVGSAEGGTVLACAQAAWGPPASIATTIPLTFSLCEWNAWTFGGTVFAPPPPYTPAPNSYPDASLEHALKFHTPSDTVGGCRPSGSPGLLPGGFGWLDGDPCNVVVTDGWAPSDTGVSGSTCGDLLADAVDSVIFVPIFTEAAGTGSGGEYHIDGFSAFYLTGYSIPGVRPNRVDSVATGRRLCRGADKCIYGYFTEGIVSGGGTIGGGGTPRGASVVQLTG